jgi:hypothetical protein
LLAVASFGCDSQLDVGGHFAKMLSESGERIALEPVSCELADQSAILSIGAKFSNFSLTSFMASVLMYTADDVCFTSEHISEDALRADGVIAICCDDAILRATAMKLPTAADCPFFRIGCLREGG